jgi:hypothetical protein
LTVDWSNNAKQRATLARRNQAKKVGFKPPRTVGNEFKTTENHGARFKSGSRRSCSLAICRQRTPHEKSLSSSAKLFVHRAVVIRATVCDSFLPPPGLTPKVLLEQKVGVLHEDFFLRLRPKPILHKSRAN